MLNRPSEVFLGCEADYKDADLVIFGAPFDATTSYRPGTRFASKVMRSESFGMETYSPYQDQDLSERQIGDGGDLELPFGNVARALDQIQSSAAGILADGKLPVMIGGEHLVTLGAVRAAVAKYPELHMVHFDAHADLRDDYLGEKYSHATVIRRCFDLLGEGKIFQFGIRSGERAEFTFAAAHTVLRKFDFETLGEVVETLKGKPVYLTIDLDVLDPSVLPGTGTPEAGGVSFLALIQAISAVCELWIVGCDLNELCPVYDPSGASTAVACKVLRELLLSIRI